MDAIRVALIDFNRVAPAQVPLHRRRMELILRVPTLLAHSTLRFTAWREVVAEFVAERTGPRARRPRAAGDRARRPRRRGGRLRALARRRLCRPWARCSTTAMRQLGAAFDGSLGSGSR